MNSRNIDVLSAGLDWLNVAANSLDQIRTITVFIRYLSAAITPATAILNGHVRRTHSFRALKITNCSSMKLGQTNAPYGSASQFRKPTWPEGCPYSLATATRKRTQRCNFGKDITAVPRSTPFDRG